MRDLENLEIHVAHGCNLACESCSHYSNQGHAGLLGLDEADRWMRLWNQRLRPSTFSLLGGEPSIHPQLPEFVALSRRRWPHAKLRLVTNGFFLHRHPTLPLVLRDDPNACIREEEPACGMCPASPERFTLPMPLPARSVGRRLVGGAVGPRRVNGPPRSPIVESR